MQLGSISLCTMLTRSMPTTVLNAGAHERCGPGVVPRESAAAGARQYRQGDGAAISAPQHGLPPRQLLRRPATRARLILSL